MIVKTLRLRAQPALGDGIKRSRTKELWNGTPGNISTNINDDFDGMRHFFQIIHLRLAG